MPLEAVHEGWSGAHGRHRAQITTKSAETKSGRRQERLEAGRAHLLFPFDQHPHVDGKFPVASEQRSQGGKMHHHLPLVVASSPRVDPPLPDLGFERRRLPKIERVDGWTS